MSHGTVCPDAQKRGIRTAHKPRIQPRRRRLFALTISPIMQFARSCLVLLSMFTLALAFGPIAGASPQSLIERNSETASSKPSRPPGPGPWPPKVCDTKESGPYLQARQQAALEDWNLLFYKNRDVLGSFNRWIPGYAVISLFTTSICCSPGSRQWINHSPGATAQGREDAIQRLTALFSDPSVEMIPFKSFSGQGYAFVHFRFLIPSVNTTFSAWHGFRFEGLCFVEHWDGVQQITGNETNPIAFF